MKPTFVLIIAIWSLFALSSFVLSQGQETSPAQVPDNVKSIIKQSCGVTGCHSGKHPASGRNFEPDKFVAAVVNVPSQEAPSLKIVDTAAPEKSYLLAKIKGEPGIVGKRMPANRDPLSEEQIRQIEEWIKSLRTSPAEAETSSGATMPFRPASSGRGPVLGSPPAAGESAGPAPNQKGFSKPAFWGTRLINLPTTTTLSKGDFLFRISHRFDPPMSDGWDVFYGLDGPAHILFSLGYGITDDLMVTVGRSNLYQEWEFNADWAFLEQGQNSSLPISAALQVGGSVVSQDEPQGEEWSGRFRLSALVSLSYQLNDKISFLLVPAFASNANFWEPDSEGTFALGIGGRFMLFDDFSLIAEWVPPLAGYEDFYSGWGFGVEKKIGGHVFQLFVTDSVGLIASQYLPGGDLRLGDGDFRLGFNIFRTF
jgi:hypothetical protein